MRGRQRWWEKQGWCTIKKLPKNWGSKLISSSPLFRHRLEIPTLSQERQGKCQTLVRYPPVLGNNDHALHLQWALNYVLSPDCQIIFFTLEALSRDTFHLSLQTEELAQYCVFLNNLSWNQNPWQSSSGWPQNMSAIIPVHTISWNYHFIGLFLTIWLLGHGKCGIKMYLWFLPLQQGS